VYSEIHDDEKSVTAVGFWARAVASFAQQGIVCERVITDNGACYKSRLSGIARARRRERS
jgi:Integrase core domain.